MQNKYSILDSCGGIIISAGFLATVWYTVVRDRMPTQENPARAYQKQTNTESVSQNVDTIPEYHGFPQAVDVIPDTVERRTIPQVKNNSLENKASD